MLNQVLLYKRFNSIIRKLKTVWEDYFEAISNFPSYMLFHYLRHLKLKPEVFTAALAT